MVDLEKEISERKAERIRLKNEIDKLEEVKIMVLGIDMGTEPEEPDEE